jgi:hypothetical protein
MMVEHNRASQGQQAFEAPACAPALVEISGRLAQLSDRLSDIRGRMTGALDRASGPEPKDERPPGNPVACAVVPQIHDQLNDLDRIARDLANEAERLERLA